MPIVPMVVDQTEADATEALRQAKLLVSRREASSSDITAGKVILSEPSAGKDVPDGTEVTIEVSTGPATTIVPVLIGKTEMVAQAELRTAELVSGTRSTISHATIALGSVIASDPVNGTEVAKGSKVDLTVSTGPAADPPTVGLVTVPDLFGMTPTRSKRVLSEFGLRFSTVARKFSDEAPKGAVLSSFPAAGQTVSPGSYVAVDVSDGPEPSWAQYLVPGLLAAIGLVVVGAILLALFKDDLRLLNRLADRSVARGLITFLIAISTVGIALILAVSTVVSTPTADDDRRFDRAKQVLTILIGVLGTIVGFYFGSTDDAPAQQPQTQTDISKPALLSAAIGKALDQAVLDTTGLTAPVVWSSVPDLPPGLSINKDGHLVGTSATAFAKTQMKITATDAASPPRILDKTVELEIR